MEISAELEMGYYIYEKVGKVPNDWIVKEIQDLVERTTETIDPLKCKATYDYVGLENILPNQFTRVGKGKSNETSTIKVIFKKGDLLYGKLRPYLNKVWIADINGVGSTEFLVFGKNENTEWIYFNLQLKRFLNFTTSVTAGTQHPRASWRDVKRYKFAIPKSQPEQRAITTILSKVDKTIKAVRNTIQTAENLKKSLMQNLLTGKLKPDGTRRKEEEFKESKIGLIPKNWEIRTIKDLSTQVTDGEHYTPERSDSGYYLLSARNIKNSYLDLSKVDYVNEKVLQKIQRRCNPKAGDIFISCSGTIGNVCIVPEGINAGMVRSVALVKLKRDEIEPEYTELVLQSFPLQNQMKVAVASSVQGNIFQGAIQKLKIAYPPNKKERDAITNKITSISILIKQKQFKIKTLQRLKKSLMQNLLTGKIRVDVDKINEIISKTKNQES